MIERHINKTIERPPYPSREDIKKIHEQLTIVDLHADSLLWGRDLLRQNPYGHVDFPRLSQGNVAIQVFGVVTQFPFGINLKRAALNVDLITLLSILHRWPRQTWNNLFRRAEYQSNRLHDLLRRSRGNLVLIRSVQDVDHFIAMREDNPGVLGALLALEGAHAIQGELSNLRKLYELSFRIFGISHFIDNEVGGSASGRMQGGLSTFGYKVIQTLQELHMIIDLAHASRVVFDQIMELVKKPVIVSHTGVYGTCNNRHNLTDIQIKQIAQMGGLIGIAMFERTVCGKNIEDTARAIRYVADLVDVDFVGIGSDFDGAITAPFDVRGLPLLTKELLAQGFSKNQIAKIMGGNALRVFRETLPRD